METKEMPTWAYSLIELKEAAQAGLEAVMCDFDPDVYSKILGVTLESVSRCQNDNGRVWYAVWTQGPINLDPMDVADAVMRVGLFANGYDVCSIVMFYNGEEII